MRDNSQGFTVLIGGNIAVFHVLQPAPAGLIFARWLLDFT
jgi:hypothetical protein